MTTMMSERFRRYTRDEVKHIVSEGEYEFADMSYLTAISNFAAVLETKIADQYQLRGLEAVDIPVFDVTEYESGIFHEPGEPPIIFINENSSILDYDFISEIHPQHDWDVYLWSANAWADKNNPLGNYGNWFRLDVYPDGMLAFDGKNLDWPDLAPHSYEED